MSLEEVIKGVSEELEKLVNTNTVIGEPITFGEQTLIPVSRISFGFGTGGGEGKKNDGEGRFGGGGGAGARIEPVAFIVVSPEGVRLLSITGQSDLGQLIDLVPELIEKLRTIKNKVKKGKGGDDATAVAHGEQPSIGQDEQ